MFDIGLPEFVVIAIVALLVFGPDRLPHAAAQAGRLVRQLREAASSARSEMAAAAGLDGPGVAQAVSEFRALDPRRLLDVTDESTPNAREAPEIATGPGPAKAGQPGSPTSGRVDGGNPDAGSAEPPTVRRADPDWI